MSEKKDINKQSTYNKHNSFFSFSSINQEFNEDKITKKIQMNKKLILLLHRVESLKIILND